MAARPRPRLRAHTFVHEIHHLLVAIAEDTEVEPHGASFRDGNRAAEVCDGIALSAKSGQRAEVRYRELQTATTTPHQRPSSRLQET